MNGLRVVSEDDGSGPVTVIVHDVPSPGRLVVAAGGHRVVQPELPGFGRSDKPPAGLDFDGLCQVLVAWLDTMGFGSCRLVGHGAGSVLALAAAQRWRGRVDGVVSVPRGSGRRPPTKARFARGHAQTCRRLARGEGLAEVRRDAMAWLRNGLRRHQVRPESDGQVPIRGGWNLDELYVTNRSSVLD